MLENLKAAYRSILSVDDETARVVAFAKFAIGSRANPCVVDVGCGYGRTLRALRHAGLDAVGVDVNPEIVASNKRDGLKCFTPDELELQGLKADVLIMSHVIEHFAPPDLLKFLNDYLELLVPGGYLLIATPLLNPRFYDDFDHIKPYQPLGLSMVFGGAAAQVQYYGRHQLRLKNIWFRRNPHFVAHARGLYIKSWATPFLRLANLFSALAYRASSGIFGQVSGWVGLFEKIEA